jgi:homocysteine S-methyltransferase
MSAITLLDGGMGQELIHRSGDTPTPLWSTQVMLDHPGMVQAVHETYFAAGATVATTNTYAIHRDRLNDTPYADRFKDLHKAALAEAAAARKANGGTGRIAGSIGPLVASYQPGRHPAKDKAVPRYAEVAGLLSSEVDLIMCETVASLDHADAILEGAAVANLPIWLCVTVDDEDGTKLRSGEATADICALAQDRAAALLVNCSAPEVVGTALTALAASDLPIGAYANGFQQITKDFLADKPTVDALSARRDLGPTAYADFAMDWIAQGATIVGGCCEVGPAHISELAGRMRDAGHDIV